MLLMQQQQQQQPDGRRSMAIADDADAEIVLGAQASIIQCFKRVCSMLVGWQLVHMLWQNR